MFDFMIIENFLFWNTKICFSKNFSFVMTFIRDTNYLARSMLTSNPCQRLFANIQKFMHLISSAFFGLVTNTTEAEKSADCLKWCWCLQWCWRQKHYFGHQHLKRVNNNNRRQHRCSWFCVPDHFFAILRFRL